ncbi:hypothetical protein E1176_19160 [Fulvivirga sp. RKSG066]|uniref:hypothetical protein n=1 Tax=Fulvivirga aurantia TaxID=2529383 RepID=UPI0012BD102E|nr:hypothetical protein [Fulvivirga aurantia]MTI23157.1 hypothetical protein [Fulvivirga aurantia]
MSKIMTLNRALLMACVSMYFGTGWSLILFSFPIAPELTVDNYYMQFVPQVQAATNFFTYMTMIMMVCCIIWIISDWKNRHKWYPIIVLVLVIVATLLTTQYIFEYNQRMTDGITDAAELRDVLRKWMNLNTIRVSIWTLQWLTMITYYVNQNLKTRLI